MTNTVSVVASELNHVLVQLLAYRMVRRWMRHMTNGELRVFAFILDQTLACGVYGRVFPLRFIERGDWNTGPEETRTCGTGIGQRQLRRLVGSLEAKGFINVDRTDMTEGLLISINLYGNPGAGIEPMPERVIKAYEFDARMSGVHPRAALPGFHRSGHALH